MVPRKLALHGVPRVMKIYFVRKLTSTGMVIVLAGVRLSTWGATLASIATNVGNGRRGLMNAWNLLRTLLLCIPMVLTLATWFLAGSLLAALRLIM